MMTRAQKKRLAAVAQELESLSEALTDRMHAAEGEEHVRAATERATIDAALAVLSGLVGGGRG